MVSDVDARDGQGSSSSSSKKRRTGERGVERGTEEKRRGEVMRRGAVARVLLVCC